MAALAALATTTWHGATEHLPALALRAMVASCVVVIWPMSPALLRRRDLTAPAVAVLVALAGFLAAGDSGLAVQSLVSVVLVSTLYAAVLAAREDHSRVVLAIAVGIAGVHALWAVVERLIGSTRASAGFFNPNDLAAFLAPLAVVVLGRAAGERRLPTILTSALLVVGVVSTGSRSGALALLLGGGVALAGHLRRPWQRLALAGVAGLVLSVGIDRWRGKGDSLAYARLDIWKASASLALARPLGVGLGGYSEAMRVRGVPLDGWVRFPRTATHAHSEVLNAWVEVGWLGLAAVLLPALFLARVLRRSRAQAADWGVLVALAVPALVSNSLHV
ncbi:MAG: O-antigen ligase family protein, partial [Deltaproteobacteria bacterium]|nr:O-antigen ligase family protein [Deltaproteobacteria bacterium]